MGTRLLALVSTMTEAPKARHFVGLPPVLTGGRDERAKYARARLLIAEEASDKGVRLIRFTDVGEEVGDTYHESFEYAKEQADFEYGDGVGEWGEVPEEVEDAIAYGLAQREPQTHAQTDPPG